MRNGGKELKQEDEFVAELKKRKWREIDNSHRVSIPTAKSLRDTKTRITMYMDTAILLKFKEMAKKEKIGYQTLINDRLRQWVEADNKEAEMQEFMDDLLKDKKFLRKLKSALAA